MDNYTGKQKLGKERQKRSKKNCNFKNCLLVALALANYQHKRNRTSGWGIKGRRKGWGGGGQGRGERGGKGGRGGRKRERGARDKDQVSDVTWNAKADEAPLSIYTLHEIRQFSNLKCASMILLI